MRKLLCHTALALVLGAPAPAQTPAKAPETAAQTAPAPAQDGAVQLLTPGDGTAIAAILQNQGYRAQLDRTEEGAPRIRSASDGINFSIGFVGCDGADCRSIMFSAGFRMDTPPSLEAINDWNRQRNIGHAYINSNGNPGVIFFVPMEGGISPATFDYAFRTWRVALADYAREIGFR
jgi:hypothetical protein